MWHLGHLEQDLFVLVVAPWYPKSLFSAADLVWNTSAKTVEKLPCTTVHLEEIYAVHDYIQSLSCYCHTCRRRAPLSPLPLKYSSSQWLEHNPKALPPCNSWTSHGSVLSCVEQSMENGRLVNILWACLKHHIVLAIGFTPLHNVWCVLVPVQCIRLIR